MIAEQVLSTGTVREPIVAPVLLHEVTVVGVMAGAAVCAGTLTGLDRAVTGSAVPYIPAGPAALIVAAVAALTLGTIMTSFAAMSRQR